MPKRLHPIPVASSLELITLKVMPVRLPTAIPNLLETFVAKKNVKQLVWLELSRAEITEKPSV
jgi:hypothetical protein